MMCRKRNIVEQTFYRWRNKYGGMEVLDARKLRELESENARLKRMVAEQMLVIEVASSLTSQDVILTLTRLMRLHGKPEHIRSDQGAEFTAGRVMKWLRDQNVGSAFAIPSAT